MSPNSVYYKELLSKYLKNTCTPIEVEELFSFLSTNESNKQLLETLKQEFDTNLTVEASTGEYSSRILDNLLTQIAPVPIVKMRQKFWVRTVAAAAILALVITVTFIFYQPNNIKIAKQEDRSVRYKNDVLPGGDKAVLILANGQTIVLDSVANGTIGEQGNTKILKLNAGQLSYAENSTNASSTVVYNSIVTPRGGQYQIVLPDGTSVWLNASSSLRFPTAFMGKERKVEISGEAYFEVKKNATQPFIVQINGGAQVEVLGTHFNIMAYDNEVAIKTTLLEGAINMKQDAEVQRLKPGQQAQLSSGKMKIVSDVDVDQTVAWKNGLFDFNDDSITDIMRQLSRWYDIDVSYDGVIPEGHYVGSIRRKSNISEVLKMLELAGDVRFEIQGKKVIVKR